MPVKKKKKAEPKKKGSILRAALRSGKKAAEKKPLNKLDSYQRVTKTGKYKKAVKAKKKKK